MCDFLLGYTGCVYMSARARVFVRTYVCLCAVASPVFYHPQHIHHPSTCHMFCGCAGGDGILGGWLSNRRSDRNVHERGTDSGCLQRGEPLPLPLESSTVGHNYKCLYVCVLVSASAGVSACEPGHPQGHQE